MLEKKNIFKLPFLILEDKNIVNLKKKKFPKEDGYFHRFFLWFLNVYYMINISILEATKKHIKVFFMFRNYFK